MKCPSCGSMETRVKDSRPHDGKRVRDRVCTACGHLFRTVEELAHYVGWTKVEHA